MTTPLALCKQDDRRRHKRPITELNNLDDVAGC